MVVQLSLDYAAYTQGLDKSDQAALRFARNTQRNFDEAKASVTSFMKGTVASAAGAIGAMIAVNESFSKSLEFNKSIAQISTQIDGSISDLKRLEAAAKSMSVQFGTLPVDQAKAFYEIISSGTDDITAATDLLSAANKLAIGGITDLATSVDGLTNIMNSYSGKVESAEAVSDALFVGMKAGKATMEEFSSGLGKVTPLASSLNVSFDELVASIAALSKQGISASEGITGMRAILAAIAKPTKEARDMAESLGIEFNVAGLQAKGFAGFLDEVTKRTGGNADALALLFGGVEALVPAMAFAGQAGQDFNAIMADMENKAGATQAAFEKMAASPGFKIDQLMASINNIAITLGDTLAGWLVPAAEAAANALNNLFGIKQLSAVEQQTRLIADLRGQLAALNDRKNIPVVGDFLFNKRDADLLEQRIDDAVADLSRMEQAAKTAGKETATLNKVLQQVNAPKALSAGDAKNDLGKRVNQVKQLASESERLAKALQEEGRRLTEQIDPLVKKNNEIDRYKTLLESGAISEGIYSQAVERSTEDYLKALGFVAKETETIEDNTRQLGNTARDVFDSMEQIAIQGVRNIQSSFADGIFNFFDRGLKGMVDSVVTAVGRMASEFASIKLLQAAGGLFGLGGASAAFASGGGGGASSALSLASLGSGAANLFKTGFGATGLIGGGLSALGGSSALGMFGAGMQGGSAGAAFIAAESATGGAAASLGASMGSVAGPLIALAVVDQVGRLLAGNKSTGTFVDKVPVIGGFASALFGRGPMKFREQQLLGNASAGGFAGEFVDVSRAKGGLLVGNKHSRSGAENESAVLELFDTAIKGFAQSARGFADALGLDASAIDSYNEKIFIRSQKTKQFTEEEISGILSGIGDSIATQLMPGIETLSVAGESAYQTLTRLGNEFDVLVNSATILGKSLAESRAFISGASFEGRSAFVEAAGGLDALSQKAAFFADNFLDAAERLAPAQEQLTLELGRLGLASDLTKMQFRDLVQSFGEVGGISEGMLNDLLNLQSSFISVRNAENELKGTTDALTGSTINLMNAENQILTARDALIASYRMESNELSQTIAKFRDLSRGLLDFRDSMALGQLSPLTPQQKLDEARAQFNRDRIAAGQGDERAIANLPKSAQDFLQASQVFNASSAAFISDFELVRGVLDSVAQVTESRASSAESQLAVLDEQVKKLVDINESVKGVEDAITDLRNALVSGAGNAAITDQQIRDFVAANPDPNVQLKAAIDNGVSASQYASATGAPIGQVNSFIGAQSGITDQQIRDFISANPDPFAVYNAAIANGISSARLSSVSGWTQQQIDDFVKQNNLAKFEAGTDFVPSTGLALVHKGEAIAPSSMVDEIKMLRAEVTRLREDASANAKMMANVISIASKQNAAEISRSNEAMQVSAEIRAKRAQVIR